MKTHEQILDNLKNVGTLSKSESWVVDGLVNILFDSEEILHVVNSNIVCYHDNKIEKNETGYLAICTNERIIFIKKTLLGVKSEIVLIKNINTFETNGNKVVLKLGERKIDVDISSYKLVRNFTLILGYITAEKTITLAELKTENEQHQAHLDKIKRQQQEEFDRQVKAVVTFIKKVVKHKSFRYWFPVFIVTIAIFMFSGGNKGKDNITQNIIETSYQQSNKLSDYAEIVEKTGDEIHVELYYNNLGGNDLLVLGSNICEYVFEKLANTTLDQKTLKLIATANVTTQDSYGNKETKKDKILIAYWTMEDVKKFNCQNYPDIFEKTITNPKLFDNKVIVTSDFYWKLYKECQKGARHTCICSKMVVKNPNSF